MVIRAINTIMANLIFIFILYQMSICIYFIFNYIGTLFCVLLQKPFQLLRQSSHGGSMKHSALVLLLILILAISSMSLGSDNDYSNAESINPIESKYTTHASIRINSNADFDAAHGVINEATGNGTVWNPWIIEGWDIRDTGQWNCFYIGNTTEYFIIRDCIFHDSWTPMIMPYHFSSGLHIHNSSNGHIENVQAYNTQFFGIAMEKCHNFTIQNCLMNNTAQDGMYVSGYWGNLSTNILVNNCTAWDNNDIGLDFALIDNLTLTNCVSRDNTQYGLYLSYLENSTIANNSLYSNTWRGARLKTNKYTTFKNNLISNHEWGLLITGNNNTITNNTISYNTYGIYSTNSAPYPLPYNNSIYHNNFIRNSIQAYDIGNNSWNNSYPNGGNFWSDYSGLDIYNGPNQDMLGSDGIGDSNYSIQGTDHNYDEYPLMEMTIEDTFPPDSDIFSLDSDYFTTNPISISANASDLGDGVSYVELWYRSYDENSSFSEWINYSADNTEPWSWSFDFPLGENYYEFYSVAVDLNGNSENGPSTSADEWCYYDITPPTLDVGSTITTNEQFTAYANASDTLSGISSYEWKMISGPGHILFGNNAIYHC